MDKDEYYECGICHQLCDDDEICPNCENKTVHRVIELTGIAITGNNFLKLDESIFTSLVPLVNKKVTITIRE